MKRTIKVTLTEAQYRALSGAVAVANADFESLVEDGGSNGYWQRQAKVLDRAWSKINAAWHERVSLAAATEEET